MEDPTGLLKPLTALSKAMRKRDACKATLISTTKRLKKNPNRTEGEQQELHRVIDAYVKAEIRVLEAAKVALAASEKPTGT
jgi:hypothetical protein